MLPPNRRHYVEKFGLKQLLISKKKKNWLPNLNRSNNWFLGVAICEGHRG